MNHIFKCLVKFGLFASFLVFFSVPFAAANSINVLDVEKFLDERIKAQLKEFNVPNATVSVVVDGKIVFLKGYGYANIEEQIAVDPEQTLFRVGSISKLFTWTAVMQLVEQGKIDLDADVNTYLDFEIPTTLLKNRGDMEPVPITMAHLLTHTAGFEDTVTGLFVISEESFLSLEEYLKDSIPARISPAGEVMAYSNYGTALAGYIVERISDLAFEEYVEKNILEPLKMNNSTFRQPLPKDLVPNLTKAYRNVEGEFLERGFEFMPAPAGGMSTTANDMGKFMIAHLEDGSFDGGRILEEETIKQMHTQKFTYNPKVAGMTHGFIENYVNGQRVLSHAGSTMLFDGGLYLLPEQNIGIHISYSGGSYLIQTEIFQNFMDRYFPKEQALPKEQLEGAAERGKQFVGEYHANRKNLTNSDKLLVLLSGVITIDIDEDGYLLANLYGEKNRFMEIEPGIYENMREEKTPDPYGQFRTIVFDSDPYGKQMLITDGPMTYSKPAWYSSRAFTVGSLMLSMLILFSSLIYWLITFIIRKLKGRIGKQSKLATAASWTAVAFGLAFLAVLISILGSAELDPVYQLPVEAYDPAAVSLLMKSLPILLSALAISLLALTVVTWRNKYWSIFGRIHYTIYTGAAQLVLSVLYFWNVL